MTTPVLFTPFALRGVTLRNRIVVAPMCQYHAVDGVPQDWHFAHHGRFALAGVGACIAEATGVSPQGRISPGCTGIWNEAQVAAWSRIAAFHKSQGVVPGIQISHAGGKASTARPWQGAVFLTKDAPEPGWETVGPSAVPLRPDLPPPRPMTEAEIAAAVADFGAAAARAVEAGFELVEVHGAHGYLVHSFFSPLTNRRDDAYGGDLAGRMRMPLEVARAVRHAVPEHLPVAWRASVTDNAEGGLTVEDSVALARELKAIGIDLIDCSAGGVGGSIAMTNAKYEQGHQVPLAEALKRGAGLATMAVGLIRDPLYAESILAEGRADLVALARELLADASWPYHAAIALGLENPEAVLPRSYGFYLAKRAVIQGR